MGARGGTDGGLPVSAGRASLGRLPHVRCVRHAEPPGAHHARAAGAGATATRGAGPWEAERRAPRCTSEEALFGPVTAAAGWGHSWYGCRTGPSPKFVFERAVREDRVLRRCLDDLGVSWLDGHVRLAGTGAVVEIVIDELVPEDVDVRPCLLRVAGYRLVHAGCELEPRIHFVRF